MCLLQCAECGQSSVAESDGVVSALFINYCLLCCQLYSCNCCCVCAYCLLFLYVVLYLGYCKSAL